MNNQENRAVVTVKKGVDVDALMEEITSIGSNSPFVPTRKVQMWNEKNDSLRNFDVVLTKEEVEILRNDPRIIDVRWGSKLENGIVPKGNIVDDARSYDKSITIASNYFNWGIPACCNTTNPFTSNTLSFQHRWTLAGDGVDVVIQDSGIEVGHPEWLNADGSASRLQLINWPSASGLSGTYTQNSNHYTDPNGHGTHVAGTAVGRRYGWAKNANIYAITMIDNAAAFGISASFNMIRGWHNLKTNGRPTVVNMSWGYFGYYVTIDGGNYRGTPWTGNSANAAYGMLSSSYNYDSFTGNYYHPIRVASVDADIEDCLDAGIIMVAAAGNDAHKADVPSGADYNNYFYSTLYGENRYYHQGATPNIPGVITVGSIRSSVANERKSLFSTCGPAVKIYAPGEYIMSAIPATSDIGNQFGTVNHPDNSAYKATKISGTSMASPQVAGVIATILGSRPWMTQADVLRELTDGFLGVSSRIPDTAGSYTDYSSLQSSPNRYLQQPFRSGTVYSLSSIGITSD